MTSDLSEDRPRIGNLPWRRSNHNKLWPPVARGTAPRVFSSTDAHRRPPSTRFAIGSLSGQEMCGAAIAVVGIVECTDYQGEYGGGGRLQWFQQVPTW